MLKPKVVKLIVEEMKLGYLTPFKIEGETTPYRLKKDGGVERFKGQTWVDSSYSYLDLILLLDSNRIAKCTEEIVEYSQPLKETVRRRRK